MHSRKKGDLDIASVDPSAVVSIHFARQRVVVTSTPLTSSSGAIQATLATGAVVLSSSLEPVSAKGQVAVMLETRDSNGKVTDRKHGYVDPQFIKDHVERFEPFARDRYIFERDPCIEEIKQSAVYGNCSLLAGLIAILQQPGGVEFIRNMMVQLDDGTTMVRLYDSGNPIYLKVPNQLHLVKDQSVSKHGAYWIHILEQALVMLKIHKGEDDKLVSLTNAYDNGIAVAEMFNMMFGGNGHSMTVVMNSTQATSAVSIEKEIEAASRSNRLMLAITGKYTQGAVVVDMMAETHAYAVVGIDRSNSRADPVVILRNPWGTGFGRVREEDYLSDRPVTKASPDGLIRMTLKEFKEKFSYVTTTTQPFPQIVHNMQREQQVRSAAAAPLPPPPPPSIAVQADTSEEVVKKKGILSKLKFWKKADGNTDKQKKRSYMKMGNSGEE